MNTLVEFFKELAKAKGNVERKALDGRTAALRHEIAKRNRK